LRKLIPILLVTLFSVIHYVPASSEIKEIMINEVELNPAGNDNGEEKVELYNPSNNIINVSGWTITSTRNMPATVVLGKTTIIPPMVT
jgi:hypothetical protein